MTSVLVREISKIVCARTSGRMRMPVLLKECSLTGEEMFRYAVSMIHCL